MFNNDGVPDLSFGKESKIYIGYPNENTTQGLSHLQSDDKIILIGNIFTDGNQGILLYRYLMDFEVSVSDNLEFEPVYIYPNPVNNNAIISYYLDFADYVKFELYNYIGEKIRDLNQSKFHESGQHSEIINLGDDLKEGLYLLRFSSSKNSRIYVIQVSH